MTAATAGRKTQRRAKQTRQRLIAATQRLPGSYDYRSVTLDRNASEVGVSKSSILRHLGNNEALFDLFEAIDVQISLEQANLPTMTERTHYRLESVVSCFKANPQAKGIAIGVVVRSSCTRGRLCQPRCVGGGDRARIADRVC